MLTQNYSTVHLFDMNGDTLSLLCEEEAGPVVSMLFIRDVLAECQGSARGGAVEMPVCSFLVTFRDRIHFTIQDMSEPYLKIECDDIVTLDFMLHQLRKDTICFDESARARIPKIGEMSSIISMRCDADGNEKEVSVMEYGSLTTERAMALQIG